MESLETGSNGSLREIYRKLEEHAKLSQSGVLDLRHSPLAGADFSGFDLSDVDFSGSDMQGVNLSNTKLFKAVLRDADLQQARLCGADLTAADLSGCNLNEADLTDAGMGMARLDGATLFRAELSNTTLTKASLRNADLRLVNLRMARVREAELDHADLTNANLEEADLSFSTVNGTVFKDCNLRGAFLQSIRYFENATWVGADMREINFSGAYLLRRYAMDQNYIKEFKERNLFSQYIYYIWWLTSDCGRSLFRWCVLILLVALFYGFLFSHIPLSTGLHEESWFLPYYYSVVTLTTLGYGDIVPVTIWGQILALAEVITGYVLLGGLLSIFSNKLARRAE